MTREEAIEYNKNLREYMKITDKKSEYKFLQENYEALEMAIKALEQEPCEDAISRQIISDYVESHIQEINTGYGNLNKHTNEILRMIVDYIESMPPVTPKIQMIQNPCVECGCNYCTNDDCENRYIVDIQESEE